jgi:hypothetical protein
LHEGHRNRKIQVIIENPAKHFVEHTAEVKREGDLLRAVGAAIEAYRTAHHDIPLFDFSTTKIEHA